MEEKRPRYAEVLESVATLSNGKRLLTYGRRVEYFGWFNWGQAEFSAPENSATKGGIVMVDGRRIPNCTFADTEAGFVRTYDVFPGRGRVLAREYKPEDFPGREVECPADGVLQEILRGEVRVFGQPAPDLDNGRSEYESE